MQKNNFDWNNVKQLSIAQGLLAAAIPSAGGFVFFHGILPQMVKAGVPILVAWPLLAVAGFVIIVSAAFLFLKHESRSMGITLAERLCMEKNDRKTWLISVALIFLSLGLTLAVMKPTASIIQWLNFKIPDYMPFFLNPEIDPMNTPMSILSPGLDMHHQYWILPLMGVVLFMNILAEELYFRAWMLPKLSRLGHKGWILNGILFACYHTFQLWLLPVLLVASLTFAFIFYYSKSIWPSFAGHFVLNFLFSIAGIAALIIR